MRMFNEWDELTDIVSLDDIVGFLKHIDIDLSPATLIDVDISLAHRPLIYSVDSDEVYLGEENGYHEDIIDNNRSAGLRSIYNVTNTPLGLKMGAIGRIGYGLNARVMDAVYSSLPTDQYPSIQRLTPGWKRALRRTNVISFYEAKNCNLSVIKACISKCLEAGFIDPNFVVLFGSTVSLANNMSQPLAKPLADRDTRPLSKPVTPYIYKTVGDSFNRHLSGILNNITEFYIKSYRDALDYIVNRYPILTEAKRWWPQQWSDGLFCPERNFGQRYRARKFLKWLISNGVDANQWLDQIESGVYPYTIAPPNSVGGGVGLAYIIKDKVVKCTTDQTEAKVANALVNKEIPNLTKFHSVAEIPDVGVRPRTGEAVSIFAIISNLVPNKIPGKYRTAANAVYNYLDLYNKPITDIESATNEIMSNVRFMPIRYRHDQDVKSGVRKILTATDEVYKATGILLQDPHGANVLMRGKSIEFFDVGRSSGQVIDKPIAKLI